MVKKFLLLILMINISISGYTKNKNTVTVSPDRPEFSIRLKANPTTGYTWQIKKIDEKVIHFVGKKYIRSNSKLIGSGGETVLTFQLKGAKNYPEKTQLMLFYSQKWNPNKGTLKKFTINIRP